MRPRFFIVDHLYRDNNIRYFITINHSNEIVNYLNMIAKWYISIKFQREQPLVWDGFKKQISFALIGEKENIKTALTDLLF